MAQAKGTPAIASLYHDDVRYSWTLVVMGFLGGCASPPGGFDSPVPAERLNAVSKAARERDQTAIPKLITLLNSDDPVVRLAAIRTLELLTGQTLGYDHAAPEWRRQEVVRAWELWNNHRESGGMGGDARPGSSSVVGGR